MELYGTFLDWRLMEVLREREEGLSVGMLARELMPRYESASDKKNLKARVEYSLRKLLHGGKVSRSKVFPRNEIPYFKYKIKAENGNP